VRSSRPEAVSSPARAVPAHATKTNVIHDNPRQTAIGDQHQTMKTKAMRHFVAVRVITRETYEATLAPGRE
jgi:hypothetical protein